MSKGNKNRVAKYKLYWQVSASKYAETLQQNRDYDFKANAMLAFSALQIGVAATVLRGADVSSGCEIECYVTVGIALFVLAIIAAIAFGVKAVSLRDWRRQPKPEQLRGYADTGKKLVELYAFAGDAYAEADKNNLKQVADKAVWLKRQAIAVFTAAGFLLYLAIVV